MWRVVVAALVLSVLSGCGTSAVPPQATITTAAPQATQPTVPTVFKSRAEVLAAAPDVGLARHQLTWNKERYELLTPVEATSEISEYAWVWNSQDAAHLRSGLHQVLVRLSPEVQLVIQPVSDSVAIDRQRALEQNPRARFPYADHELLIVEYPATASQPAAGFQAFYYRANEHRQFKFRVQHPQSADGAFATLSNVLLALKCAESFHKLDPFPTNPAELTKVLSKRIWSEVTCTSRVAWEYEVFPNVQTVVFRELPLLSPKGDLNALAQMPKLKRVVLHPEVKLAELPPEWLAELLKYRFLGELELHVPLTRPEQLEQLARLPKLQDLTLVLTAASLPGLAKLAELSALTRLNVTIVEPFPAVECLRTLGRFPALESLVLQAPVTERELEQVVRLRNLKQLEIRSSRLSGEPINRLQLMFKLEQFTLVNQAERQTYTAAAMASLPATLRELTLEEFVLNEATMDVLLHRFELSRVTLKRCEMRPQDASALRGLLRNAAQLDLIGEPILPPQRPNRRVGR